MGGALIALARDSTPCMRTSPDRRTSCYIARSEARLSALLPLMLVLHITERICAANMSCQHALPVNQGPMGRWATVARQALGVARCVGGVELQGHASSYV